MSTPKSDCELLMNAAVPFAKQMLDQHGEFHPFGSAMRTDGQIVPVARYDGKEHPHSVDVMKELKEAFVAGAKDGQFKATALVYDVRVTLPSTGKKSDAIAVALDHRDDLSVIVLIPYKIEKGSAALGSALAQEGEGEIFPGR